MEAVPLSQAAREVREWDCVRGDVAKVGNTPVKVLPVKGTVARVSCGHDATMVLFESAESGQRYSCGDSCTAVCANKPGLHGLAPGAGTGAGTPSARTSAEVH